MYIYMYISLYLSIYNTCPFSYVSVPISCTAGRVWGNDATDLTSEHWGYLGACAGVTFLSIRCPGDGWHPVIWYTPVG